MHAYKIINDNNNFIQLKRIIILNSMPSWPEMPTPTSAIWIIETSFAPSPIANVLIFISSFTTFTRYAFCNGVERQHKTQAQCWHNVRNGLVKFDLKFKS